MKPQDNHRKWAITRWKQAQNTQCIQSCPTDMLEGSLRQNQFSFAQTAEAYKSGVWAIVGDRVPGCPCPVFRCTASQKGKLYIWSRLQTTKTALVRHLKAFPFQPPPGQKYLCWKTADWIVRNSDFPLSIEWRSCSCPAVWCDRAAVTGSVSLPHSVTFILHGQHTMWVPALLSDKCIQLSLENNKRFLHFCKQLVPLSALGGKNMILIADWISPGFAFQEGAFTVLIFFFW